jgi:Flp pilus assembly protein TadG
MAKDRHMPTLVKRRRSERGAALLEVALTLPLLMFVCVGILEFGRAYQTWQVLTNAAREGARVAVLPGMDNAAVTSRVRQYMAAGALPKANDGTVTIDINRNQTVSIGGANTASASHVTVNYPFDFMVLDPIARLATRQSNNFGSTLNMVASATMRNES